MHRRSLPSLLSAHPLPRLTGALALALATVAPAMAGDVAASSTDRVVSDPVLVPMYRALRAGSTNLLQSTGLQAAATDDADKDPKLNVRLTEGRIFNPATQRYDRVSLRSYVAEGAAPNPLTPFVAPTLRATPGDTVRITIDNQLKPEPDCKPPNINTPHCFNSTNLHSHGLWISPTGNSDNVLITIRPKVAFEYEYNIPATHPAGTFWYHPHLHGSTALQVSSGMAGALIINGARPPVRQPDGKVKTGDIDTLLRSDTGAAFKERLVLFQQVQYACRDADGQIKVKKNAAGEVIAWVCDPNDVGTIEGVLGSGTGYDQFGPSSWAQSGRYTSINGKIMPMFEDAVAGHVERWRNIHAGVRNTINLQFRPMRASANPLSLTSIAQHDKWIAQNCAAAPLPQWEIASDGLTHGQIIRKDQNVLQPGYRSDVLMVFPTAGTYCVIDAAAKANATVGNLAESRQLLGVVRVSGEQTVTSDLQAYLTRQLQIAAQRWMPADVKQTVTEDLARDLRTEAFVPHATITEAELTPNSGQHVEFNIAGGQFMVDGKPYSPDDARELILGQVEEWTLTSLAGSHPFHIHVNPFQVVKILNPQGVDVSVTGEADDPQYANLKGTWKDTLFVKQGYKLFVRTRYERYIGEYVLHCHILDHEDQGMMQNVQVLLPDGTGGAAHGHH